MPLLYVVTCGQLGFENSRLAKQINTILYSFDDIHVAVIMTCDVLFSGVILQKRLNKKVCYHFLGHVTWVNITFGNKKMFIHNVGIYTKRLCLRNNLDGHACHAHEKMWFVGIVFTQVEPILRVTLNSCDLITQMLLILYNVKLDHQQHHIMKTSNLKKNGAFLFVLSI